MIFTDLVLLLNVFPEVGASCDNPLQWGSECKVKGLIGIHLSEHFLFLRILREGVEIREEVVVIRVHSCESLVGSHLSEVALNELCGLSLVSLWKEGPCSAQTLANGRHSLLPADTEIIVQQYFLSFRSQRCSFGQLLFSYGVRIINEKLTELHEIPVAKHILSDLAIGMMCWFCS